MRSLTIFLIALLVGCGTLHDTQTDHLDNPSEEQLLRHAYTSAVDGLERDAYIYLPKGYDDDSSHTWPVMIYLHGDGERGDGKEDLDYVMGFGPLYEAWVQKKDMPFILIVPQLHMFGRDGPDGPGYILNRTREGIPRRQEDGVPPHHTDKPAWAKAGPMKGAVPAESPASEDFLNDTGWRRTEPDLINILDSALQSYHADKDRVYLTGASMGGFGTCYFASTYPDKFTAIVPVVGFPSVEQAEAIAKADIPVWIFSGGRDPVIETKYFFAGMNRMDELGATIRFTTEQDMLHDVWNRVYAGDDVYNWLLSYRKP